MTPTVTSFRRTKSTSGSVANRQTFQCPVCGFDGLRNPAREDESCPCCGTQFGYSDAGNRPLAEIHAALRSKWISRRNVEWQSRRVSPPPNWNPWMQLIEAGFVFAGEIRWLDSVAYRFVPEMVANAHGPLLIHYVR